MEWLSRKAREHTATMLKTGDIPKHVAFIMDGNRRFARKRGMEVVQGHSQGFEKLKEVCDWGLQLGVEVFTVYAFSIENFKRPEQEVSALMDLAADRFGKLLLKGELIDREGIRIRVLGNITMLPSKLQQVMAKAVETSKHNKRAILNVCFAYTGRDEIVTAAQDIATAVNDGTLLDSDICEELVEQALLTEDMPAPELLVRTSGEVRLSDFLLWQTGYSCLCFRTVLWPDFSFWHFAASIVYYQRHAADVKVSAREAQASQEQETHAWNRQALKPGAAFLSTIESAQTDLIADEKRQERVRGFLEKQRQKRARFFEDLTVASGLGPEPATL